MSPCNMKDAPSAHDHFTALSGIGSAFAAAAPGLRLIRRRFGAGAFGLALAVEEVPASWANASVAANIMVVERAPTTVAISNFFMESRPFRISVKRWRGREAGSRQG